MAKKKVEIKYRKEEILLNKTLDLDIDILNIVLEEDKEYTLEEVEKLEKNFRKRVIK